VGELLVLGKGSRASPYRPIGVWFAFRLPPALLLNVPIGDWPRSPHDTRLFVGPTGEIRVHCRDASETYGRHAVLQVAATFLRALKPNSPATVSGVLTPGNGDAELNYQITIGAAVVIARTIGREPPTAA
jgi:hypothetical protein